MTRHRLRHARELFSIKKRGGGWRKFMNFNSWPGRPSSQQQAAAVMCRMIFNKLPASVARQRGVREREQHCTRECGIKLMK
jgi:hypothetical protein